MRLQRRPDGQRERGQEQHSAGRADERERHRGCPHASTIVSAHELHERREERGEDDVPTCPKLIARHEKRSRRAQGLECRLVPRGRPERSLLGQTERPPRADAGDDGARQAPGGPLWEGGRNAPGRHAATNDGRQSARTGRTSSRRRRASSVPPWLPARIAQMASIPRATPSWGRSRRHLDRSPSSPCPRAPRRWQWYTNLRR